MSGIAEIGLVAHPSLPVGGVTKLRVDGKVSQCNMELVLEVKSKGSCINYRHLCLGEVCFNFSQRDMNKHLLNWIKY